MKKFFKNPFRRIGEKLKKIATFVFWAVIVLATIGGIVAAAYLWSGAFNGKVDMNILYGIIIVVLSPVAGVLLGWILGAPIYAFGKLVSNTSEIRYYTSEIEENLKNNLKKTKRETRKVEATED